MAQQVFARGIDIDIDVEVTHELAQEEIMNELIEGMANDQPDEDEDVLDDDEEAVEPPVTCRNAVCSVNVGTRTATDQHLWSGRLLKHATGYKKPSAPHLWEMTTSFMLQPYFFAEIC